MRFIRTKNNRAPDGEDRYAVRSTCFLAEDRNTIVLQGDGFIAAGRISAQCDMDAKVKDTSAAERDITEKPMYIMQQYRDTALAERWDNAFALCYRRI